MHDLHQHVASLAVTTAIPNRDPDAVQRDLRSHVYAHVDPPTDGPSQLEELKDTSVDGHPGATEFDAVTAGWEPEPKHCAYRDNVDEPLLEDAIDTLEAYLYGRPFDTDGAAIVAYLPPAAGRKYLHGDAATANGPVISGVVTDIHGHHEDTSQTAIQLAELHTSITDNTVPAAFTADASPPGLAGDTGWVQTNLLSAVWCLVPHTPNAALHLQPTDTTDTSATATRGPPAEADLHLHSPSPTDRTMRFTAETAPEVLEVLESLADSSTPPIRSVTHVETDPWFSDDEPDDYWTVANDHLIRVLDAILETGYSVSLTLEIEARYLPDSYRPDDAPPLPWHGSTRQ